MSANQSERHRLVALQHLWSLANLAAESRPRELASHPHELALLLERKADLFYYDKVPWVVCVCVHVCMCGWAPRQY